MNAQVAALRDSGDHEAALNLLARLAQQQPSADRGGTGEIVGYLLQLGSEHRGLVLRFTRWLLLREPSAAVDIFVSPRPDSAIAPPLSDALQMVLELPAAQQPPVLTELLRRHGARGDATRGALVRQLVVLLTQELEAGSKAPEPTPVEQQLLRRLQAVLGDDALAEHACAETTLGLLEAARERRPELTAMLAPHCAQLLARLGRHERALQLLAAVAPALALQYCEQHYAPDGSARGGGGGGGGGSAGVFDTLLAAYLQPAGGGAAQLDPALELLRLHAARVDAMGAVRLLPADAPLGRLLPRLEALLRLADEQRRAELLRCNLHKAVSVQVHASLLEQRRQRLVVTDAVACCVCGRRLGNVAFAALPGGGIAHIGCCQRPAGQETGAS